MSQVCVFRTCVFWLDDHYYTLVTVNLRDKRQRRPHNTVGVSLAREINHWFRLHFLLVHFVYYKKPRPLLVRVVFLLQ